MTKICTKCGKNKPLNEFDRQKSHKDGLSSHCKKCIKFNHAQYNEKNKEMLKEKRREWKKLNPDYLREYEQKYKLSGKKAEKDARYRLKHKESRCIKRKRQADKLSNSYIKRLLYRKGILFSNDMPEGLIELKKETIKLHRLIKQVERIQNEDNERTKKCAV